MTNTRKKRERVRDQVNSETAAVNLSHHLQKLAPQAAARAAAIPSCQAANIIVTSGGGGGEAPSKQAKPTVNATLEAEHSDSIQEFKGQLVEGDPQKRLKKTEGPKPRSTNQAPIVLDPQTRLKKADARGGQTMGARLVDDGAGSFA